MLVRTFLQDFRFTYHLLMIIHIRRKFYKNLLKDSACFDIFIQACITSRAYILLYCFVCSLCLKILILTFQAPIQQLFLFLNISSHMSVPNGTEKKQPKSWWSFFCLSFLCFGDVFLFKETTFLSKITSLYFLLINFNFTGVYLNMPSHFIAIAHVIY